MAGPQCCCHARRDCRRRIRDRREFGGDEGHPAELIRSGRTGAGHPETGDTRRGGCAGNDHSGAQATSPRRRVRWRRSGPGDRHWRTRAPAQGWIGAREPTHLPARLRIRRPSLAGPSGRRSWASGIALLQPRIVNLPPLLYSARHLSRNLCEHGCVLGCLQRTQHVMKAGGDDGVDRRYLPHQLIKGGHWLGE